MLLESTIKRRAPSIPLCCFDRTEQMVSQNLYPIFNRCVTAPGLPIPLPQLMLTRLKSAYQWYIVHQIDFRVYHSDFFYMLKIKLLFQKLLSFDRKRHKNEVCILQHYGSLKFSVDEHVIHSEIGVLLKAKQSKTVVYQGKCKELTPHFWGHRFKSLGKVY